MVCHWHNFFKDYSGWGQTWDILFSIYFLSKAAPKTTRLLRPLFDLDNLKNLPDVGSVGPDVVVPVATRAPTSAVVESDQFVSVNCVSHLKETIFCCFPKSALVSASDSAARIFSNHLMPRREI